ncbi:MAG: lipocalin-like domain-containing protein [Paracoccaceae bacterium]
MSDATASFCGTWRLVTYTIALPDGLVINPLGSAPRGQIVYTPEGRMAAHLMHGGDPDPDAPPFPDPLIGGGYCGSYRIEGNRVFHDVEIATVAGRPGTSLMREWSFDGADLLLVAYDGPRAPLPNTGTLRWRKI